jgi:histidinol-phosphate aminotransferase
MNWLETLARPEIVGLKAYEHASFVPGLTRLHANELPARLPGDESIQGLNRYPEPQPQALVQCLACLYHVDPASLLLGRGSDEMIDLLVRAFCRAGEDAVLICPPTFGMYRVAAEIQGASIVAVPLNPNEGFALDPRAVLAACDAQPAIRLVFLCSPNNPTGNLLDPDAILEIAERLTERALVVVDEAYIEFAETPSLSARIDRPPNLAILRTLSKAHGLAGARIGSLIAAPEVITLLKKLVTPYGVPQLVLEFALNVLKSSTVGTLDDRVKVIRAERERLRQALSKLPRGIQVLPSDANFLLARFKDATTALEQAARSGLLVRDVRRLEGLRDALRISVGTQAENDALLKAWA